MLYKIREIETGRFFVTIPTATRRLDPETGNLYKISEFVEQGGHIFDSEAAVNRAMKNLTTISKPTQLRPHPILPTYTRDELEIIRIL